ncbi:MAG: hypothetical protein ACTTJW_05465 [Sphaerochaeta sp.]
MQGKKAPKTIISWQIKKKIRIRGHQAPYEGKWKSLFHGYKITSYPPLICPDTHSEIFRERISLREISSCDINNKLKCLIEGRPYWKPAGMMVLQAIISQLRKSMFGMTISSISTGVSAEMRRTSRMHSKSFSTGMDTFYGKKRFGAALF